MRINHTQITDFQKCEKRFYFAHILKLRPKAFPASMSKGIFGHVLAEVFFKAMQEGKTFEECVHSVNQLIEDNLDNLDNLSIYRHVLAFGAYAFEMQWHVISVEEKFITPSDGHDFAYTPDIIFQWTRGPRKGSYFMLDFKFTSQQWNDREINMYQQLPKYSIHWNIENPDKKVHQLGVVNLLTRAPLGATGNKLFVIKWLKITREKIETIERENIMLMERVVKAKENNNAKDYLRTSDSYNCKMCWFGDDICPADLEGKDISKYVAVNYEVNTWFDEQYGVEKGEEMNGADWAKTP